MKIYTKTGDAGQTALFGGARVSKADGRVQVYGEVDELNSALGLARAEGLADITDELLGQVQGALLQLGAELATAPDAKADTGAELIGEADVTPLEAAIDAAEAGLEPLKTFILPGGCRAAAQLHCGRTLCRRAERSLVAFGEQQAVRAECIRYLNRLSDLLFVLARDENRRAGVPDVAWTGGRK